MKTDERITLTLPGSVLCGIHLVAAATRDEAEKQGLSVYPELRDVCRSIEGALRAHGWKPTGDGTWTQ